MAAVPVADPTTAILTGIAMHQCNRFEGHNLRVRDSNVVHGVRLVAWLAGLQLPAPGCGQGWSGVGLDELHPTTDAVTCHHCQHADNPRNAPRGAVRHGQLELDFDLEPGEPPAEPGESAGQFGQPEETAGQAELELS
ncbi:hypothetical protein ACVDFE_00065 [Lentzea chajnantorensis]